MQYICVKNNSNEFVLLAILIFHCIFILLTNTYNFKHSSFFDNNSKLLHIKIIGCSIE